MGAGLARQCAHVFSRIRMVMDAAGGTTGDILKLTIHLVDHRDRVALNAEWLAMFPDPADRPARQVLSAQLADGALIHADLLAVLPVPDPRDRSRRSPS